MDQSKLNELNAELSPELQQLLDRYGICEECNQIMTDFNWCYECNVNRFKKNFNNWTSGNEDVDKFIQSTQLLAHDTKYGVFKNVLEWIPYDKINDIKYIAKVGVYRASLTDGTINYWDGTDQHWIRYNKNMVVTLKNLINPKNVTLEYINKVLNI
jgi:hypothetical protein